MSTQDESCPLKEDLIKCLVERLKSVSSLSYDQSSQVARYLVESETVTFETMFDMSWKSSFAKNTRSKNG